MTVFGNIKNFIRGNSPPGGAAGAAGGAGGGAAAAARAHNNNDVAATAGAPAAAAAAAETTQAPATLHNQFHQYTDLQPRYTLLELIGEGAFSKVFKAYDSKDQHHIAIKIIDKANMTLQQINSVLKEISIMSKIRHDNVVQLYAFKNTAKHCYLMMELVTGGEIFNQIIRYTYFSEDLSRFVIVQVAQALKYLHEEVGVVHRDIKPENLLFEPVPFRPRSPHAQAQARRRSDDDNKRDEGVFVPGVGAATIGTVKIADFGLSKVLWDNHTKTPVGTQGYTAPEILKDESYSKAVDCFSLGCVLYTLLCGFPPFYDSDPKLLAEKVSRGEYYFLTPWWNEISQGAKDLVSNLLTVDAAKRYTVDDLLRDPWVTGAPDARRRAQADDYPTTTTNRTLYEQFNTGTSESVLLTPRAEAIRFAFDTSNAVQLKAIPQIRGLRITEETLDDINDDDDEDDDDDDAESSMSLINDDDEDDDDPDSDETTQIPVLKTRDSLADVAPFKRIINAPAFCITDTIHFDDATPAAPAPGAAPAKVLPKTPTPGPSRAAHTARTQHTPPKPRMVKTHYTADTGKSEFWEDSIKNFDLKLDESTMLSRRKLAASTRCGDLAP